MNTSLNQSVIFCLFAYSSTFFGCHGTMWNCRTTQQEVQQERFVRIGGRVNNPGRVDLGKDELTLRQGIQLAAVNRNDTIIAAPPRNAAAISLRTNAQLLYETGAKLAELLCRALPEKPLEPDVMLQIEELKNRFGNLGENNDDVSELGKEKDWALVTDAFKKIQEVLKTEDATASQINGQLLLVSTQQFLPVLGNFIKTLPQGTDVNTTVTAFTDAVQLVSLRRQANGRVQTYLFPYSFVMNGDAGGIALEHGDFIAVVPVSESPLNVREAGDGAISVAGYVQNGGDFEPAKVGKRSIGEVFDYAGSIEGIEYEMISCVLSRYSSNGDGLVTVIAPAPHRDSFAREILVSGGDQISFTPTPLAPLIVNSFISGSARNLISDEVLRKKSSVTGLQKVAQSTQQCANQIGQQTRKGFNQVLSGQMPSMTRKSAGTANDAACAIPARIASR